MRGNFVQPFFDLATSSWETILVLRAFSFEWPNIVARNVLGRIHSNLNTKHLYLKPSELHGLVCVSVIDPSGVSEFDDRFFDF